MKTRTFAFPVFFISLFFIPPAFAFADAVPVEVSPDSSPFLISSLGEGVWVSTSAGAVPLTVDADGRLHFTYRDSGTSAIRQMQRSGGVWSAEVSGAIGFPTDAFGNPVLCDLRNHRIEIGQMDGAALVVSVAAKNAEPNFAVALDAGANPHLAYVDRDTGYLKYVRSSGGRWLESTVDTHGDLRHPVSIALDGEGRPHIAYVSSETRDVPFVWEGTLKAARFDGRAWRIEAVDSMAMGRVPVIGCIGDGNAIALDGKGRPHISYYGGSGDRRVKYAWSDGKGWRIETVCPSEWTRFTSIVLDASGVPHIAFTDDLSGKIKTASWMGAPAPPPLGGNPCGRANSPRNLRTQYVGGTSVVWNWEDASLNESGFRIYGGERPTGPFTLIGSVPGNSGAYIERDMKAGTQVYRYVAAAGPGGVVVSSGVAVLTSPGSMKQIQLSTEAGASASNVSLIDGVAIKKVDYAIPPGAVLEPGTLRMTGQYEPEVQSGVFETLPGAFQMEFFPYRIRLLKPATIALEIDEAMLSKKLAGRDPVRVKAVISDGSRWMFVPGSRLDGNKVKFCTRNLGFFAVAVATRPASDFSRASASPNPYKLASPLHKGLGVTFSNLVPGCEAEVYTIRGKLLATLLDEDGDGLISWNPADVGEDEDVNTGDHVVLFKKGELRRTLHVTVR